MERKHSSTAFHWLRADTALLPSNSHKLSIALITLQDSDVPVLVLVVSVLSVALITLQDSDVPVLVLIVSVLSIALITLQGSDVPVLVLVVSVLLVTVCKQQTACTFTSQILLVH